MHFADKLLITFIGDIFPGELPYTQNYGVKTQFETHHGLFWLSEIKKILGESDLVIGNLESPLLDEGDAVKGTFWGKADFGSFLKSCGINIVNVANNHILEHGNLGFEKTIKVVDQAGIGIIGQAINLKSNIYTKVIKGFKIAIAGFSNIKLDGGQKDVTYAILTDDNVLETLKSMGDQNADLKILCFHWGNEYVHIPSIEQRKMAYKFIDFGANIIVGHHPHVIQPYEKYKNGHIFYSLGNFIFDFIHSRKVSIGLSASIEVTKENVRLFALKGVKLSFTNTVELLPIDKFEKYYKTILLLYQKYSALPDVEYQQRYQALHKRNRFWQRIAMKKAIIDEFFRINTKDKAILIKNVILYYSHFIKKEY